MVLYWGKKIIIDGNGGGGGSLWEDAVTKQLDLLEE